jgi:hypothetical protein
MHVLDDLTKPLAIDWFCPLYAGIHQVATILPIECHAMSEGAFA